MRRRSAVLLTAAVASVRLFVEPSCAFTAVEHNINKLHRQPTRQQQHTYYPAPQPRNLPLVVTTTLSAGGSGSDGSGGGVPTNNNNNNNNKQQTRGTTVLVDDFDDGDKPAGVVGAQFFGGNKEKEEFYDADAEMAAAVNVVMDDASTYSRFADRAAFADDTVAAVAESLQMQINRVLFAEDAASSSAGGSSAAAMTDHDYSYADNVQWETGLQGKSKNNNNNPLQELEAALGFYRRVDVAIVSGERLLIRDDTTDDDTTTVQLRWEISVQWPAMWEPRVLLTGTSTLTLVTTTTQLQDKKQRSSSSITKQVDTLDADLLPCIQRQILPRFWDLYHIGMTPAAEEGSPKLNVRSGGGLLSLLLPFFATRYTVYELPPRLVLQPTLQDFRGQREDSNAAVLPNHAFSCVIKTMGPTKQRFTPVTGVQVQLVPPVAGSSRSSNGLKLQWSIPIATEYASNPVLVLPGSDPEMSDASEAACQYVFAPRRMVATIPYGGGPQDVAISDLRKKLYEQVVKDGLTPVLDASGRPVFFFSMNSIKACYTEEGLGMAVYEWRPQFTNPNEVGIELEL